MHNAGVIIKPSHWDCRVVWFGLIKMASEELLGSPESLQWCQLPHRTECVKGLELYFETERIPDKVRMGIGRLGKQLWLCLESRDVWGERLRVEHPERVVLRLSLPSGGREGC